MDTFGLKIKGLRKSHGIKQNELADHLKIATSTLSQYENNKRHPNFYLLKEIALFFNVSTDYLLGLESKEKSMSFRLLKEIDTKLHEDHSFIRLMDHMTASLYGLYSNKDYKSLQISYLLHRSISDISNNFSKDSHQTSVKQILSAHQKQKEIIDHNLNLMIRHHLKYYGK